MVRSARCGDCSSEQQHWPIRPGMSDKTARHYRDHAALPSVRKTVPRTYRTRSDPFACVWPAVEAQLRTEPKLLAKTLFDWLRSQHPGQFFDSHRRTFERRVRHWRSTGWASPRSFGRSTTPATWLPPISPARIRSASRSRGGHSTISSTTLC